MVNNVSADLCQLTNVTEAFISAMLTSLGGFADPVYIEIINCTYVVNDNSRRLTVSRLGEGGSRTLLQDLGIVLIYRIIYLLEDTIYTSSEDLGAGLSLAVRIITGSDIFVSNLQAQNVPELSTVTSTTVLDITTEDTEIVRSGSPSMQPTVYIEESPVLTRENKILMACFIFVLGITLCWLLSCCCMLRGNLTKVVPILPTAVAFLAALFALFLVSFWSRNNIGTDVNYLGQPSWRSNVLAWHPTLMVGGFFTAQVLYLCDYSWHASTKMVTDALHPVLQVAALSCMIAGMCAIVKHKLHQRTPSLTTMHSWVGVSAVVLFCCSFSWNVLVGVLYRWYPESVLHRALDVRLIGRCVGLVSLGLSVLSIVSGVMDELSEAACVKTNDACKLANGVGVCVAVSAVFAVLSVACDGSSTSLIRKKSSHFDNLHVGQAEAVVSSEEVMIHDIDEEKEDDAEVTAVIDGV